MSKGSRPRPFSVSLEEYNQNLTNIFGEKPKKEQYIPPPLPEDMQNIQSSFEKQMGTKDLPPGRT
jgi:hypothetical protein